MPDTIPNSEGINPNYPCKTCPYKSNANCAKCIFAAWNVEGISAAFGKRLGDPTASPLVMGVPNGRAAAVQRALEQLDRDMHPKLSKLVVPSHNRMAELMNQLNHR